PSNVKFSPDGSVKVLDFGLAKDLSAGTSDASRSPTIAIGATQTGVILGTAAYMSPEQARGLLLDKRSDIWAFGCVVYEMLTGRQAFGAATVTDTLAAIVRGEPDWSALPAATPRALRTLLGRCLQKDPRQRLRDIGDARLEIEDAIASPSTATQTVAQATQPARLAWAVAAAAIAIAIVATSGAVSLLIGRNRVSAAHPVMQFTLALPPAHPLYSGDLNPPIAISPDGTRLAYVGLDGPTTRLYV